MPDSFAKDEQTRNTTAPSVDGYRFLFWAGASSDGWVGTVYPLSAKAQTTSFWRESKGTVAKYNAWAVYIAM